MFYYLTSEFDSALKINSNYIGRLKDVNLLLPIKELPCLVEICPLTCGKQPINFILNQDLLNCPPKEITITNLDGGYLIKINDIITTTDFKIIAQKKFTNAVCTVFSENGYKLSIETPTDFFAQTLDFEVNNANITQFNYGKTIAIEFNLAPKIISVFNIENKITPIMNMQVENLLIEDNSITTTVTYQDIAQHKVTTTWKISDNKVIQTDKKVDCSPTFSPTNCIEQVLPYCFLEELLVGGDIKDYLTQNMLKNASKLTNYLGDFIGIIPPPTFKDQNLIGLVYKKADNLFEVKYLKTEMQNNKISNIKLL